MPLQRPATIRNIAVPTDSSGPEVIALSGELALRCGATVHLFSAEQYPLWATSVGGEYVFAPLGPPAQMANVNAERRAAVLEREASGLPAATEVSVVVGEVQSSLLDFLEREAIDLVVTGSKGVGFWTRILHSSLAGNLSRVAPVPVLVVPPSLDVAAIAERGLGTAVIATNGETIADLGGAVAAAISRDDAELWFVHVADAGLPDEAARDNHVRELESLVADVAPRGTVNRAVVEHGEVAEAVVRRARELGADLVIVGSRPHGSPGDRLAGTIADQILADAPCCVIAVPAQVRDERDRHVSRQRRVDRMLDASFPASDPPSFTP